MVNQTSTDRYRGEKLASRTLFEATLADGSDVSGTHALAILPESDLILLDRDFVRGDVIKRSLDKIESGVVMKVSSFVQLEHCISGETVAGGGWVPMNKLASSLCVEAGDKVVYNNWLGTIKDVSETQRHG